MPEQNPNDARLTDDFDPIGEETFTSAHATHKQLRQTCPVAHSSTWKGFWALFRYDDVVHVLKNWATFTTTVQNVVPKVAFTGRRPPLHFDPPEHTPYRRALNAFFTPAKMANIEPALRRITGELLEPLIDAGGGDVCEDFTRKLPGYVFAEFFNIPAELSLTIKGVSAIYARAVQVFDNEAVKETSLQLYDVARQIIEMRKAQPMDPDEDVTCALLVQREIRMGSRYRKISSSAPSGR